MSLGNVTHVPCTSTKAQRPQRYFLGFSYFIHGLHSGFFRAVGDRAYVLKAVTGTHKGTQVGFSSRMTYLEKREGKSVIS